MLTLNKATIKSTVCRLRAPGTQALLQIASPWKQGELTEDAA